MKKTYGRDADPKREREAQKYDNPIPSREAILEYIKDVGCPVSFNQIIEAMEIDKEEERVALKRRLGAMERDGQLFPNRHGYYGLTEKMDIVKGRVTATRDGPGEVVSESGNRVYLPTKQMKGVFHGDAVMARPIGLNNKGRLEGMVEQILQRNTHTLTGRYQEKFDAAYVVPVNPVLRHDVLILRNDNFEVEQGTLVGVKIISQPTTHTQPVGEITEILGEQIAIDDAIDMAIKTNGLAEFWPAEVTRQVEKLPDHVDEEDRAGRTDLRHLPFVTIDGADAKDFDDAVYCIPKRLGGWRLYVAIADVSYYVRPGSPLDKEAQTRSTSVYFPGKVIPMLPEKLSNGLCSLNPHVDRLALVCEMTVSKTGKLTRSKFYSAIIQSQARLTYDQVGGLLDGSSNALHEDYPHVVPYLYHLHAFYQTVKVQREMRGALDFDTLETEIILNQAREVARIAVQERNDAHRLIEECMLMANVAAARLVKRHRIPAPYRVHEGPNPQKVEELRNYLKIHGLKLGGGLEPTPQDYAKLLAEARHKEEFNNIQLVVLRSMNQAVYSVENKGHFGLAYPAYCHFTSPIRRYPDLITHRAIKSAQKELELGAFRYGKNELEQICEHASTQERRGDSAAQGVEDFLKCDFMKHRVGEIFDATIVNIIGIGFFVQLDENYIEGLVHVATLNGDYFHFDSTRHVLVGERTGMVFKLGQPVQVKLLSVNMASFKIDFELVENDEATGSRRKRSKTRKKSSTKKHAGRKNAAKQDSTTESKSRRSGARRKRRRKDDKSGE